MAKLLQVKYRRFQKAKETGNMEFTEWATESITFFAETEHLIEGRRKDGSQIIINKTLVVGSNSVQPEFNF